MYGICKLYLCINLKYLCLFHKNIKYNISFHSKVKLKKHTIYISFFASLLEYSIIIMYILYNYIYKQKSWMHAFSQIMHK